MGTILKEPPEAYSQRTAPLATELIDAHAHVHTNPLVNNVLHVSDDTRWGLRSHFFKGRRKHSKDLPGAICPMRSHTCTIDIRGIGDLLHLVVQKFREAQHRLPSLRHSSRRQRSLLMNVMSIHGAEASPKRAT